MTTAITPTSVHHAGDAGTRPGVTIVVPCFNEAAGLQRLRERLMLCEQRLSDRYQVHVVLVDDASTDETWEALQRTFGSRAGYRLVRHAVNLGIAAGIMTGIRHAVTDITCSMDADCTYDPLQIESMLQHFSDGVDVVTASPYHPQGQTVNLVAWRLAISRFASLLYWLLMRVPLHTYTSCFRVYRRSTVANVSLQNSGFVGVPELLWRVKRRGGQIVECPAVLTARIEGQSKMRLVSVSLGHFRLMCRILWEQLFTAAEPSGDQARIAVTNAVAPSTPAPSADAL